VRISLKGEMMNNEEAFETWWDTIKDNRDQINLRIAFDAGYKAGKESE
jgi:hypothetical protein